MSGIEQLLVSGSDARLSVDAGTGLNRFGCAPLPRASVLSFGSSTASSISPEAFCHVQREYQRLCHANCPERHLDTQMETLRGELKRLLGLAGTGTEIIFSPSGTDSTLQALFLTRALAGNAPLDCLLPASDETGSGVPLALSGRHFSDRTSEGVSVTQGETIAGLGGDVTLIALPRRTANGVLRPLSCQDQDVWEAVERAAEAGRQVLLQVMDCSKLGSAAPSLECRRRIQSRFAESVHFVVDACQMRLGRTRLREHLAQGHLVLISGSKFFTGPPFSGALLVPAALAAQFRTLTSVPPGLRDYTNRYAWPQAWTTLRESLPDRANFGLYFRWAAALAEIKAYFTVPPEFRGRVLTEFAGIVPRLIQSRASDFLLLEEDGSEEDGSERGRTIFPFFVRDGSRWMSFADSVKLYQALNQEMASALPGALTAAEKAVAGALCHVGQPVRVPLRLGKDAGALRVCADARLVTQLWAESRADPQPDGLAQVEQQLRTVLTKIVLISRHW